LVVKGVRFRNHQVVGDILDLATRYNSEGADELVFYDITASPDERSVDRGWINRIAANINIPFCVAGGIKTIADAEEILNYGADKISVNSPALLDPDLINHLVSRFGSQCVVVGIDSFQDQEAFKVFRYTGDPSKTVDAAISTLDWVNEVQDRGAGEIVLNCMNQDGVRKGYDLEQLTRVREICQVPLIASGGAGIMRHFAEVIKTADVSGALAASVFHNEQININDLKQYLLKQGIEVRL
jgi:cyclase